MSPTLHWGNCHQEVPRRDSGAWGWVESRWGDRGNQCESRLGGQVLDQVCRMCNPEQLINLSGPHSLIYKMGYPQFPPAPGIKPLAGSHPGFSLLYQVQLAQIHQVQRYFTGVETHEATGQNAKRCGSECQAPAHHTHCPTHLDWKGSGAWAPPWPPAQVLQPPALGGRCLRPEPPLQPPCLRGNLQTQPKGNREALLLHGMPWPLHGVRGHEGAAISVT